MKLKVIGILSLFVLTSFLFAEDPAKPAGPSQEQMEEMMKLASPGEMHKHLGRLVGDWEYTSKMWMTPDQPAQESGGTMHAEWMLGGRYVHSVWKGKFMDMEFEGHGIDGYDNLMKKHVSTWIDNMGTGIMNSTGTCDADGKNCTMEGDFLDPMSGQKMTARSVVTWKDDKTFQMEMFMKDASNKETKSMELIATKK